MHVVTRRTATITGLMALAAATITTGAGTSPAVAESPPTVTVTTTIDSVDADTSDGTCADAIGECSLRAAMMQHAGPGKPSVIIELPAGRYELTITGEDSTSSGGSLDVYANVILSGDGALSTVIDANGLMAPLFVGNEGLLEIDDVTVTGGSTTSVGGAVDVRGQLIAQRVRLVGNHAGTGGAISAIGGSVALSRSEVADNHATNGGGGLEVFNGAMQLIDTTVSANTTGDAATSAGAGGVSAWDASSLRLISSTLSGNEGPEVAYGPGGAGASGISFERSVVGDADPQACTIPTERTVESTGQNLVTDASCKVAAAGDLVGLDPLLAPLAFYGGQTRTRYPLPGSPAIDTAPGGLESTDQRNALRSLDGDGNGTVVHDIGAVERDVALADVPHLHPFFAAIAFLRHDGITTGYADGTFRPGADITRQAFAAFLYRYVHDATPPPCAVSPFPDVPSSHPFCGAIAWMAAEGIAGGFADGGFHPADPISRQAMAAFLYRATNGPAILPCVGSAFPDVAADHPFCPHIAWMVGAGVTTGYGDGTFRPTARVTRQAMAAFLQRLRGVTAPAA